MAHGAHVPAVTQSAGVRSTGHVARRRHHGFNDALANALKVGGRSKAVAAGTVQSQVASASTQGAKETSAASIPGTSEAALRQAMTLKGVPASWEPGLRFIMARESGGQVDARNPVHSARGLFQLTRANPRELLSQSERRTFIWQCH
jgi:hypothetical protein